MESHEINVTLQVTDRKEMAHNIEMHAPILKTGIIVDGQCRKYRYGSCSDREQLYERLNAIKHPCSVGTFNCNANLRFNTQTISTSLIIT